MVNISKPGPYCITSHICWKAPYFSSQSFWLEQDGRSSNTFWPIRIRNCLWLWFHCRWVKCRAMNHLESVCWLGMCHKFAIKQIKIAYFLDFSECGWNHHSRKWGRWYQANHMERHLYIGRSYLLRSNSFPSCMVRGTEKLTIFWGFFVFLVLKLTIFWGFS